MLAGPAPVEQGRLLQPGSLTKPVRVWCTSTSIRIAWYQAEPVSEQLTVFYKKSGSLFGTEIVLPTGSLLGPDLSMRAPAVAGGGRAEYYELDIRKLKPNTQYVVKVRAEVPAMNGGAGRGGSHPGDEYEGQGPGNGGGPAIGGPVFSVRSDRLSTLGVQEEGKRDLDMGNFIGSLIKLGEYDGSVVSFDAGTGLYAVRILQVEEVGSAVQLVRLASEYSDLGLPARTYSLSSIKFGRWGGEISDSQVVGETELKWIVGRSVALAERNEAASTFSVREELLQSQNDHLVTQMDAQRQAAMASLAFTRRSYQALFAACAVLCVFLVGLSWSATWRSMTAAGLKVAAAGAEAAALREELKRLELYRVSLELDTGAWIGAVAKAGPGTGHERWQRAAGATAGDGRVPTDSSQCEAGDANCTSDAPDSGTASSSTVGNGTGRGTTPYHPLLDPRGPLLDALRKPSNKSMAKGANGTARKGGKWWWRGSQKHESGIQEDPEPVHDSGRGGAAGTGGAHWGQDDAWFLPEGGSEETVLSSDPPEPWQYVNHAATLYSLYMNEWLKQQMAQSIRSNIHKLLSSQAAGAQADAEAGIDPGQAGATAEDMAAATAAAATAGVGGPTTHPVGQSGPQADGWKSALGRAAQRWSRTADPPVGDVETEGERGRQRRFSLGGQDRQPRGAVKRRRAVPGAGPAQGTQTAGGGGAGHARRERGRPQRRPALEYYDYEDHQDYY